MDFILHAPYQPTGDQPEAIEKLVEGIHQGKRHQVLLGATGTGKPSTISRMNAQERRIVHLALKNNKAVRTQSVGDGYYRKLIIFPKKKPSKKKSKEPPVSS